MSPMVASQFAGITTPKRRGSSAEKILQREASRSRHLIGASVLLGTGAGIAFFMLMAHLQGDPRVIAGVAASS
jgi:Predicted integral membrane protein (DUF2269)